MADNKHSEVFVSKPNAMCCSNNGENQRLHILFRALFTRNSKTPNAGYAEGRIRLLRRQRLLGLQLLLLLLRCTTLADRKRLQVDSSHRWMRPCALEHVYRTQGKAPPQSVHAVVIRRRLLGGIRRVIGRGLRTGAAEVLRDEDSGRLLEVVDPT